MTAEPSPSSGRRGTRRGPASRAQALAWAWGLLPAAAAAQAPLTAGLDCLIQPSQTVQVGAASPGVVQVVRVERGDLVRKGQPVVQMEAQVERAALAVAREKAAQLGETQAARGATELAQRELERAANLVKDNFVSKTYYDRQRAEVEVAAGRGQQAEEKRRLAAREVELAAAQLAQRTVLAPVDGVVVERHVGPGEYVEQKPVLRIATIDPLRVDVLVPAAAFGQIAVGSKAQVTPELLNRQARPAVVTGVDRVVDAASHTFRVRLELSNPGGRLPPGLKCKADLTALSVEPAPAQPADPAPRDKPAPKAAGLGLPPDRASPPAAEPRAAALRSVPTRTATQVAYDAPAGLSTARGGTTAAAPGARPHAVWSTATVAAQPHPRLKLTWPEPATHVASR